MCQRHIHCGALQGTQEVGLFLLMRVSTHVRCSSNGESRSQCLVVFQQRYIESVVALPMSQTSNHLDSNGSIVIETDGILRVFDQFVQNLTHLLQKHFSLTTLFFDERVVLHEMMLTLCQMENLRWNISN